MHAASRRTDLTTQSARRRQPSLRRRSRDARSTKQLQTSLKCCARQRCADFISAATVRVQQVCFDLFVVCIILALICMNKCVADKCAFAHGPDDLRVISLETREKLGLLPSADTFKTDMCWNWLTCGRYVRASFFCLRGQNVVIQVTLWVVLSQLHVRHSLCVLTRLPHCRGAAVIRKDERRKRFAAGNVRADGCSLGTPMDGPVCGFTSPAARDDF